MRLLLLLVLLSLCSCTLSSRVAQLESDVQALRDTIPDHSVFITTEAVRSNYLSIPDARKLYALKEDMQKVTNLEWSKVFEEEETVVHSTGKRNPFIDSVLKLTKSECATKTTIYHAYLIADNGVSATLQGMLNTTTVLRDRADPEASPRKAEASITLAVPQGNNVRFTVVDAVGGGNLRLMIYRSRFSEEIAVNCQK